MKKVMVALAVLLAFLLSACTQLEPSMQAPRLAKEEEELRGTLKDILKAEARLIYPEQGEQQGAIHWVDIDGDGQEEALVFYRYQDQGGAIEGLLLKKTQGTWQPLGTIHGHGYGVERVLFRDVTGNGCPEIIVGWQMDNRIPQRVLSVFAYGENMKNIFSCGYNELAVDDLDQDGNAELVVINHDREQFQSQAELYRYDGAGIQLSDQVSMDGSINGYSGIATGYARPGQKGVFVEAGVGAHSALTELLVMEDGKLSNVFYDETSGVSEIAFKAYPADAEDINGDGIIEIPLYREPKCYEEAAMVEIPWITAWYRWDGNKGLELVEETYSSYWAGYVFHFPEHWDRSITIDTSEKEEETRVTFSYLDETGKKIPLFTLCTFSLEQWEELGTAHKQDEFQQIATNLNQVFAVTLPREQSGVPKAETMKLTIPQIKRQFQVVE